jgi:hypothetical protein
MLEIESIENFDDSILDILEWLDNYESDLVQNTDGYNETYIYLSTLHECFKLKLNDLKSYINKQLED